MTKTVIERSRILQGGTWIETEALAFSHTFQSAAPPYAIIGLLNSDVQLVIRDHLCVSLPGDWTFWKQLSSVKLQYNIVDGIILWYFRSSTHKQTVPFIDPEQFYHAVKTVFAPSITRKNQFRKCPQELSNIVNMSHDISRGSIAHKIGATLSPCPCCGGKATVYCYQEYGYDYPMGYSVNIHCRNCYIQTKTEQFITTLTEAEKTLQGLRDVWNFRTVTESTSVI